MRIISGKYARKAIESPTWAGTRPLLSRLRRALFDTLMPYLPQGPFLDLYGGTGAFTLEALSRGAPEATVIELNPKTAKLIQKNADAAGVQEPLEVLQGDALDWIPKLAQRDKPYAVISVAPPYHLGLEDKTLDLLEQWPQLLRDDGIFFVQYPTGEVLNLQREGFEEWRTKKYGNTMFTYFFAEE